MISRKKELREMEAAFEQSKKCFMQRANFKDELERLTGRDDWSVNIYNHDMSRIGISLGEMLGEQFIRTSGRSPVTLKDIKKISKQLKPRKATIHKASCTSFYNGNVKPDKYCQEVETIAETWLRINMNTNWCKIVEFNWFTKILGYDVDVTIYFTENLHLSSPGGSPFGNYQIKWKRDMDGEKYISSCELTVPFYMYGIKRGDKMIADKRCQMKWYASNKYANPFTIHWQKVGRNVLTAHDIIKHIEG